MSKKIKEEWKPIEGFEGFYEISNLGRVKSLKFKRKEEFGILKNTVGANGYEHITLRCKPKKRDEYIHRLVAKAFVPNPNNYPIINHKDENPLNNSADNLEWCTYQYNNTYGNRILKTVEKTSKKVYQYDSNFDLIKIWKSAYETRKYGFDFRSVSKCCRKQQSIHRGFIWSFSEIDEEEQKGFINRPKKPRDFSYLHKKIYQYDKSFNLIKIWSSGIDTKNYGFCSTVISECCNGRKKYHKGFIWSFTPIEKQTI